MGEKRRWGNLDQSNRDDGGRWPSKSPRHWGQHYYARDCYYTAPSWERTFCASVCRVPWRKICDAGRVMHIYKNVAAWDDSAGREAFQNAKARYWAKINNLPCHIPLSDPDMYINKVNFDDFIDPELAADVERSFFNPDTINEPVMNHLISPEHEPVSASGFVEAEQSSSNWDKYIEKPVPVSLWDKMSVKNGWGDGIVQCDSWKIGRNHSMDVNGREMSRRVCRKDQDESWRFQGRWENGRDRRNSDWKCTNSRYPIHENQVNNYSFEKKVQPERTWQRGPFLGSRNHQRTTGYSGARFQRENAVFGL